MGVGGVAAGARRGYYEKVVEFSYNPARMVNVGEITHHSN